MKPAYIQLPWGRILFAGWVLLFCVAFLSR